MHLVNAFYDTCEMGRKRKISLNQGEKTET